MNTFHDGLKAWRDLYRYCVCPGSFPKYVSSIYKVKYVNQIGESPLRSWRYLICIITRWLCSCSARLINDDVMAIGVSYWRRREFSSYARLHRSWMRTQCLHRESQKPVFMLYERWNQNMSDILRPRWKGRHFTHDSFKYLLLNKNVGVAIGIAPTCVPNIVALVQIMAWRWPDNKSLSAQWWLVYLRIYASLGINELAPILT